MLCVKFYAKQTKLNDFKRLSAKKRFKNLKNATSHVISNI